MDLMDLMDLLSCVAWIVSWLVFCSIFFLLYFFLFKTLERAKKEDKAFLEPSCLKKEKWIMRCPGVKNKIFINYCASRTNDKRF